MGGKSTCMAEKESVEQTMLEEIREENELMAERLEDLCKEIWKPRTAPMPHPSCNCQQELADALLVINAMAADRQALSEMVITLEKEILPGLDKIAWALENKSKAKEE